MKTPWVLSYPLSAQRRLGGCQADLSLRWATLILLVLSCRDSNTKYLLLGATHYFIENIWILRKVLPVQLAPLSLTTIRIFNGCEVLIENSVSRVTVRHHEAYPSDGIFNLHRRTIMDSFSCILFLRQLHLDLNMRRFINFALK